MNWIKKHYDRFVLLLLAAALIASSALIILRTRQFPSIFEAAQQKVVPGTTLPSAETKVLEDAAAAVSAAAGWQVSHPGSLFVSRKYLVREGKLIDPTDDNTNMLHPPVPNEWLLTRNFDILDPNVLKDDPDGDGFTNLDEFVGNSDPLDKKSHPHYSTKLRLKQYIRQRFRLKFAAYDGDSFQINTLDLNRPSQFLKLGDDIAGTKFKVVRFEKKFVPNPSTGAETDVSELAIQNVETGEEVTLIVDRIVDSPDSFALFKFIWDGEEIRVKKDGDFSLKVEPGVKYKLIDINANEAVITNLSTNEKIKVPLLEAPAP